MDPNQIKCYLFGIMKYFLFLNHSDEPMLKYNVMFETRINEATKYSYSMHCISS